VFLFTVTKGSDEVEDKIIDMHNQLWKEVIDYEFFFSSLQFPIGHFNQFGVMLMVCSSS